MQVVTAPILRDEFAFIDDFVVESYLDSTLVAAVFVLWYNAARPTKHVEAKVYMTAPLNDGVVKLVETELMHELHKVKAYRRKIRPRTWFPAKALSITEEVLEECGS